MQVLQEASTNHLLITVHLSTPVQTSAKTWRKTHTATPWAGMVQGGTPLVFASFSCSGIQDNEWSFKVRHAFTLQSVKPSNCDVIEIYSECIQWWTVRRTRASQDSAKVQGTRAITNGGRTKASAGLSDSLDVQHLAREEDTTPSWSSSNRHHTLMVIQQDDPHPHGHPATGSPPPHPHGHPATGSPPHWCAQAMQVAEDSKHWCTQESNWTVEMNFHW